MLDENKRHYLGSCFDVGALVQQRLDYVHVTRNSGSVQTRLSRLYKQHEIKLSVYVNVKLSII